MLRSSFFLITFPTKKATYESLNLKEAHELPFKQQTRKKYFFLVHWRLSPRKIYPAPIFIPYKYPFVRGSFGAGMSQSFNLQRKLTLYESISFWLMNSMKWRTVVLLRLFCCHLVARGRVPPFGAAVFSPISSGRARPTELLLGQSS